MARKEKARKEETRGRTKVPREIAIAQRGRSPTNEDYLRFNG